MITRDTPRAAATFDVVVAHHRARTRKAERRAETLEELNGLLFRLLGLAVEVATAGSTVDPLALLALLEDIDRAMQQPRPGLSDERMTELLRQAA